MTRNPFHGVAAGVLVAAMTFSACGGDGDSAATSTTAVESSDSTATVTGTAMAGWMSDNIAGGGMMRPMMWDSPQAMRDACVQAMETREVAGSPARWCDQMVGWMSQQTGDWDDWHDHWG